jgi:hypothetical protein
MYVLSKPLKTTEKLINTFQTEQEVLDYIKENNLSFNYPYIFTHILLSNGLIIKERISGIIVSPEDLRKQLEELR